MEKIFQEEVSISQARALMELGFPQYDEYGRTYYENGNTLRYVIPSQELVAKWLRKEKGIEILPVFIIPQNVYEDRCRKIGRSGFTTSGRVYSDYEKALSEGIDNAIKILKKNEVN